jgi:DNA-directed RNA polymerase subunit RPC12/RpoP
MSIKIRPEQEAIPKVKVPTYELPKETEEYIVNMYRCTKCNKRVAIINVEEETIDLCPYCGCGRLDMSMPYFKGEVLINIPKLPDK